MALRTPYLLLFSFLYYTYIITTITHPSSKHSEPNYYCNELHFSPFTQTPLCFPFSPTSPLPFPFIILIILTIIYYLFNFLSLYPLHYSALPLRVSPLTFHYVPVSPPLPSFIHTPFFSFPLYYN